MKFSETFLNVSKFWKASERFRNCYIELNHISRIIPVNEDDYLMGPYNAGPKSALFLRVALIKAGVRGASVIRVI